MKVKFLQNNNISLVFNGSNLELPWGIETSNTHSFLSLYAKKHLLDITNLEKQVSPYTKKEVYELNLYPDVIATLSVKEAMDTNTATIHRAHSLLCAQPTVLLDFVTRYTFPKHLFNYADINARKIVHQSQNIYYQYPVKQITLSGDKISASIIVDTVETAEQFDQYLYVRDEPDAWIVHIRLLPKESCRLMTVKLNTSWYNRSLPRWIGKILLSIPKIKTILLYRGERDPSTSLWKKIWYKLLPISAYRFAKLPAGASISVSSSCTFTHSS